MFIWTLLCFSELEPRRPSSSSIVFLKHLDIIQVLLLVRLLIFDPERLTVKLKSWLYVYPSPFFFTLCWAPLALGFALASFLGLQSGLG